MDTFSTAQLLTVHKEMQPQPTVFLDLFYPMIFESDAEEIAIDKVVENENMSLFVSPMVEGKPARTEGFETRLFKPPYIKETDIVTPSKNRKRRPGEPLLGSLSVAERRNLNRLELTEKHDKRISQREEWMGVQGVLFGSYVCEGPDHPAVNVDLGRRAGNNITLAGPSQWANQDPAAYDPAADIEAWAEESDGTPELLIMPKDVWALFYGFQKVRDLIKTDSGSASDMELGPTAKSVMSNKGMYGNYQVWVYNGEYRENGTKQKYMPAGHLLLAPARSEEGTRAYGAIMDAKANAEGIVAGARYPKNFFKDDPSVEVVQTQSSPLMLLPNVNDFVVVVV